jgi:hypothetical protein
MNATLPPESNNRCLATCLSRNRYLDYSLEQFLHGGRRSSDVGITAGGDLAERQAACSIGLVKRIFLVAQIIQ